MVYDMRKKIGNIVTAMIEDFTQKYREDYNQQVCIAFNNSDEPKNTIFFPQIILY